VTGLVGVLNRTPLRNVPSHYNYVPQGVISAMTFGR
jgi:hypothetical protein